VLIFVNKNKDHVWPLSTSSGRLWEFAWLLCW